MYEPKATKHLGPRKNRKASRDDGDAFIPDIRNGFVATPHRIRHVGGWRRRLRANEHQSDPP